MFSAGEELFEVSTEEEELQALTIEDFRLQEFAGIGLKAAGAGLITSLLVLGVISILRTR